MGIGLDNVVYVETDDLGGMIPERLEEAIQKTLDEGKVCSLPSLTLSRIRTHLVCCQPKAFQILTPGYRS